MCNLPVAFHAIDKRVKAQPFGCFSNGLGIVGEYVGRSLRQVHCDARPLRCSAREPTRRGDADPFAKHAARETQSVGDRRRRFGDLVR
jgi:hypothetical protein